MKCKIGIVLIIVFVIGISLLIAGCNQASVSKRENNKTVNIEPSNLFQGDVERLEPHLGIIGSLVKVKVNGLHKSIHVKYEIWEKGRLTVSHNTMSMPVDDNFNGEVSFSLKDDINNKDEFKMCTVISDATGYGSHVVSTPKFDSQFSHGANKLNKSINIAENEEAAVWSLLAGEGGKGLRMGDIEESAREADWALVLKVSVQESSEEADFHLTQTYD